MDSITQGVSSLFTTVTQSIVDAFNAVGDFIVNGIKGLFMPDKENIDNKVSNVKNRFQFIEQFRNDLDNVISDDGINTYSDTTEPPSISINLSNNSGKYNYGDNVKILDLSWYAPYKPFVDKVVAAIIYIFWIKRIAMNLHNFISASGRGL